MSCVNKKRGYFKKAGMENLFKVPAFYDPFWRWNIMKNKSMILFFLLMLVSFSACGGPDDKGSGEKSTAGKSEKSGPEGMAFVKGGCFDMGDTFGDGDDSEKPVHQVCVSDFYMEKYEVTQIEFEKVMGSYPAHFKNCPKCPIESVTWFEARDYCGKVGKRLPTEAEWEYAARSGGKKEKFAGTSLASEVGDYAWFDDNSGSRTHPVGEKKPNGLGLYDMSGNVYEWTADWYDKDYYGNSSKDNPKGPSSGEYRVLRGGSWLLSAYVIRAAGRGNFRPVNRFIFFGFRCAQ
jgi:formylglycine-generating enzyme required for sulfatase activity